MSTLHFPSKEFPGDPAVSVDIPEGWEPTQAPGTVLAVFKPEPGFFQPNVVISIERQGKDAKPEDALQFVAELAETRREPVLSEPYETELSGVQFHGRDVGFIDDQAGTIMQVNLIGALPAQDETIFVQITGSFGAKDAQADAATIKGIITSITIGQPVFA